MEAPVVVAHSAAGLLLPSVARRVDASHQVWLAAVIPDGTRSLLAEFANAPGEMFNDEWLGHDAVADPVLATHFLFHDCDLATLRWALGTLRRFVMRRMLSEPVARALDIRSTSIVATGDRTLRPSWSVAASRDRLGIEPRVIDAGHCPHVSQPSQVATIIDDIVLTGT